MEETVIPVTGQTGQIPCLLIKMEIQTKLTSLKWKSAKADWGQVRVDRNAGGQPLRINGKKRSNSGSGLMQTV